MSNGQERHISILLGNFPTVALQRDSFLLVYILLAKHADKNNEDSDEQRTEHQADESPLVEAYESAEENGDRVNPPRALVSLGRRILSIVLTTRKPQARMPKPLK